MKINCDGFLDNDFDFEEVINKWLISGFGGRYIVGYKVLVFRVLVFNWFVVFVIVIVIFL